MTEQAGVPKASLKMNCEWVNGMPVKIKIYAISPEVAARPRVLANYRPACGRVIEPETWKSIGT
eukprot:1267841-Lingulodinium_polyedra.AAC.1